MSKIKNIYHDIIRDIKMNPKPFCYGVLIMIIITFPMSFIPLFDLLYTPPKWKKLERIISDDIYNTNYLLQFSETDEEKVIIEELLAKQEDFKKIIPQGKKNRKDFLKKYENEVGLIIIQYRTFLHENGRW